MQTETIKSLDKLTGRTITKAIKSGYGSDISLLFNDGAVVTFKVDRGYESGDETVEVSEDDTSPVTLRDLGVINDTELGAIFAEQQREHEEEARQTRLALYEQLKREFEGGAVPTRQ